MAKPKTTMLLLDQIVAVSDIQPRKSMNMDVVKNYVEDLGYGAVFPPVIVFNEGEGSERNFLADGYHRLFAHRDAGHETIECEVHEGGLFEAQMYAWGANTQHGFRRSSKDAQRCVKAALLKMGQDHTQEQIADVCRVHRNTVSKIHTQMLADGEYEAGGVDAPKARKPKKPTTKDLAPTKPEPTQEEAEAESLRGFVKGINEMPFPGQDSGHLPLTAEDLKYIQNAAMWLSQAHVAHQKKPADETIPL